MAFRKTIDTTYADLRPSDLVIDKSGQAWPLDAISSSEDGTTIFWLCDPVSKARAHLISKQSGEAVKVSRLPTQADEASKLEAEFPCAWCNVTESEHRSDCPSWVPETGRDRHGVSKLEAEFPGNNDDYYVDAEKLASTQAEVESFVARADSIVTSPPDAVAAVMEYFKESTVEAEVTAAEVDAAAAATDDAPLTITPFADMTPLEQRSHCYLLHGIFAHDLQGKAELIALHDQAHAATATLNSRYVPHVHEVA